MDWTVARMASSMVGICQSLKHVLFLTLLILVPGCSFQAPDAVEFSLLDSSINLDAQGVYLNDASRPVAPDVRAVQSDSVVHDGERDARIDSTTGSDDPDEDLCDGLDNDGDGQIDEGLLNACDECGAQPVEICNDQDDDCDGHIDEELLNACGICGSLPEETCNEEDDDCDEQVDEGVLNACGACGPVDAEICDGIDNDCDEQVDEGVLNACGACGPVDAEICDGIDNDCDGITDSGCACALGVERACGQNDGRCESGLQTCFEDGWSTCEGAVGPVQESCNGIDDDCDTVVDEALTEACGLDTGACERGQRTCEDGQWSQCVGDIEPIPERCNGLDDDCDGDVDEALVQACGTDLGLCTMGQASCVDGIWAACQPGQGPVAESCDGLDNDCDGHTDEALTRQCGTNTGVCSVGEESCENGEWGLCVGAQHDGPEICDGLDNDCDGQTDETLTRQCGSDLGACRTGSETCVGGAWDACRDAVEPSAEVCDSEDNDCDGSIDEELSRVCGQDVGLCRTGMQRCDVGEWGACLDARGPEPELCDGADNDCDGQIDEALSRACGRNQGECTTGTEHCADGAWGSCLNAQGPSIENCDDLDNDCDGQIDEGLPDLDTCIDGMGAFCFEGFWELCRDDILISR